MVSTRSGRSRNILFFAQVSIRIINIPQTLNNDNHTNTTAALRPFVWEKTKKVMVGGN